MNTHSTHSSNGHKIVHNISIQNQLQNTNKTLENNQLNVVIIFSPESFSQTSVQCSFHCAELYFPPIGGNHNRFISGENRERRKTLEKRRLRGKIFQFSVFSSVDYFSQIGSAFKKRPVFTVARERRKINVFKLFS